MASIRLYYLHAENLYSRLEGGQVFTVCTLIGSIEKGMLMYQCLIVCMKL